MNNSLRFSSGCYLQSKGNNLHLTCRGDLDLSISSHRDQIENHYEEYNDANIPIETINTFLLRHYYGVYSK